MVLKKRLENGTISFEVPTVPRAPRSARRRGQHKKIADGKYLCPIELLACLAGKLLQESESSSASNNASEENDPLAICKDGIKQERQDVDKPLKVESLEQGSCEESTFVTERNLENTEQKCKFENYPQTESDHSLDCTSVISGSAPLDKGSGDAKAVICYNTEVGNASKPSLAGAIDDGKESVRMEGTNESVFKDLWRGSTVAMNDPESKVQKSLCRDPFRVTSSSRHRIDTNLAGRDGDENFSRLNKCSNKFNAFRHHQRIGDHRIRKLLTSKYWRAAPKLKDCQFSKADGDVKHMLIGYKRKAFHKRERYPGDCLYKKRKLFDRSSIVTSDCAVSGESNSHPPQKSMNVDKGILVEEGGTSSSVSGSHASLHIKDTHVKFSIKSFKIPELFINVPETATVGSLKRTIVEAVTAILGGGLRVGVVLRGKKIRDDNRTLLQSGLSCQENLDKLGFTLEPSLEKAQQVEVSENPPLPAPSDASHQLTSIPEANVSDIGVADAVADRPTLTNACNDIVDSRCENTSSHSDNLLDKNLLDSRALVPLSAVQMEPLAVVPMNQKSKRSELSQRRIRRPFSVSEVEALVHAVEELGTGRWRDVKLRAFENADHRTYVDLKDKWKTLVHTASISPQQRRGEPVPQELLDRVLSAHAFWSQHQGKQQGKHQVGPPKIADVPAGAGGIEVGGI